MLDVPKKLGFSGHETFPFRYGWLRKAIIGADVHSQFFSHPSALVTLGVGKNMVQSIRHWGTATQILNETGRGEVQSTESGRLLLEDWDQYLEEIGSLWLVHWWLVNNPAKAATWHYAFFGYPRREFTKAELVMQLSDWAERQEAKNKLTTIERDVDCFVRTYLPAKSAKSGVAEDSFDCPLTELGLVQQYEDGERYGFVFGPKRSLPTEVFAFALLEFLEKSAGARQTVPLHDVLYAQGSPGQAFKLSENAVIEAIEAVQELTQGAVEMNDTAGLKQIYLRRELNKLDILGNFYRGQA